MTEKVTARRAARRERAAALLALAGLTAASCAGGPWTTAARPSATSLERVHRWWILIGDSNSFESIDWRHQTRDTEMVILNDDPRIPLHSLPRETLRLAYLSVGEADTRGEGWPTVRDRPRDRPFVVEPNPNWPQNVRVDVRDPGWQELLLEREAPRLLSRGFQGLMLDTLDTAPYLERQDPSRFAGSRQALRDLLSRLRRRYPRIVLLANGTDALVDAAPYVDGYVVEGVFATYDFARKTYRQTTAIEREWKLGRIADAEAAVARPVFTIEYASVGDIALSTWATSESESRGFRPYVTVKDINSLP